MTACNFTGAHCVNVRFGSSSHAFLAGRLGAIGSLVLASCLAASGAVAGCTRDDHPSVPPCGGNPSSVAHLGQPRLEGNHVAETSRFTTTGGTLYVTAYDFFDHPAWYEVGKHFKVVLLIGDVNGPIQSVGPDRPVDPSVLERAVYEDEYVKFEVPPGEYWVLSNNLASVDILSCSPNVLEGTSALPVVPYPLGPTVLPPS